jgi:hypothetical protein
MPAHPTKTARPTTAPIGMIFVSRTAAELDGEDRKG